jgi:PucR family transcriptional regulator, purine catabolism regulatory protein
MAGDYFGARSAAQRADRPQIRLATVHFVLLMSMTLRDVLELDAFQRAEPEIVSGGAHLDRPVRWVHSSEIAEIAPLLKGGELLLTTGLGLADAPPSELAGYVDELADRNVAGVAIELGRTFDELPAEMADAARRRDLTLVALHEVVPFVEVTEEAHAQLIDRLSADLRRGEEVSRRLTDALLAGEGLARLMETIADIVLAPVVLATATRHVVAAGGSPAEAEPEALLAGPTIRASITLQEQRWGELYIVQPSRVSGPLLQTVLERAPEAIALELLRTREAMPARERTRRELLEDLAAGRSMTPNHLAVRFGLAGFHVPEGHELSGLAIGLPDVGGAMAAVDAAISRTDASTVRAQVDGDVLGILGAAPQPGTRATAEHLADLIARNLGDRDSADVVLALGPPVNDLAAVPFSVREARATLAVARQLGLRRRMITAAGLTVDRIVARLARDPELTLLVDEQIGPLLRHDAAERSDLVATLATYLGQGCSKTAAARVLHLRRQSLYGRLERIEGLIGGRIDDPERRLALALAVRAHALLRQQDGPLPSVRSRTPARTGPRRR